RIVFCGHQTTTYIGNLTSQNSSKNNVLQLLFNTQAFPNGGDGWIQIMEFYDDKKTIGIHTYSTQTNSWNTDPLGEYTFIYSE
ncbi:MAG TPA: hypothetical protein VFG54_11615, partial [Prolixibacteraceae bacterium]|nr:hypothetical protein [Prolixibacteraceae bacterium]